MTEQQPISIMDDPQPKLDTHKARRPRWGQWVRLSFWLLMPVLLVWNVWLAWESRPVRDLTEIARSMRLNQFSEAEQALRDRLRRSPHDGESRMLLARLLAQQDDLIGCAEQLHEIPFWWPEKAEALYLEKEAYYNGQHAPGAESAWRNLIAFDPLHPPPATYFSNACMNLAKLYLLQNRSEEAVEVLWQLYEEVEPRHHESILSVRFESILNQVRPDHAVEYLRQFVETVPDDWNSRRALALAEQANGRPETAIRQINACLEALPDDPKVHRDRLIILEAQEKYEALAMAIREIPEKADRDARTWNILGTFHERSGRLEAAAEADLRAFELDPTDFTSLYRLALLEQRLGRPEQAQESLRRHAELRASLLQLPDAFQEYQASLSGRQFVEGPDRAEAIEELIRICEVIGWTREAEAWRALL